MKTTAILLGVVFLLTAGLEVLNALYRAALVGQLEGIKDVADDLTAASEAADEDEA